MGHNKNFTIKYSKSKKGHNSCKNEFRTISLIFTYIPLFIKNIYFEFQVYKFSNGRNMTNVTFSRPNDNTKTKAMPQVFSKTR